jgi:hypothetical protein
MANKKSGIVDAISKIGGMMGGGAKNGKKLKKAFLGLNETLPMGKPGMGDMFGKLGKGIGAGVSKAGGPMAVAQAAGDVIGGIQQGKQDKAKMNIAKQTSLNSGLALQASQTQPEQTQRTYVRPEDNINTGQELSPTYGVGTTLAKNGTEIANTFAPNTIYTDLGYAADGGMFSNFKAGATNFSNQGGFDALSQLTSGIGNPKGQDTSGGGQIGRGAGKIVGNVFGGPVLGEALGFAGEKIGDALDQKAEKTKRFNDITDQNMTAMAFGQGAKSLQQANSSYVRDGGMVSPQVINQFGDYKLSQLLQPDPTMDTLRAGGHLKSYTPPSERAMYTGREQFAMGGNLKTHWGGSAKPISYNHHLPEGGETVMFEGNSHDESDGKGRTGIGASYGDTGSDSYTDYAEYGTDAATGKASVEVEKKEPAVQLKDASTGDTSLTVYGNLELSESNAELIGMPDQAKRKYKNIVADLSKDEQKQNKIIEKSVTELDKLDLNNPYNILSFESRKASLLGANMNLKKIADQKIKLADMQSATNKTAEEFGLNADSLAKGKVKQAKKGASIKKAQGGTDETYDAAKELDTAVVTADRLPSLVQQMRDFKLKQSNYPKFKYTSPGAEEEEKSEFDWMTIANQILPYLRPSDAEELDPRQLSGEMLALAQNQLEPVQAQTFQPQLSTPYDISLQDIINKNQADYRAAQRMIGYNPAALASLNAQKYQANQQVLGEQFRLNQGMRDKVYSENRAMLNESNLQNLGILDRQYERQQQALSNTKATAQAALNSISSKYLQNQASNRELQAYENLYNFRSGPNGIMQNMNPLAQFNTALGNLSSAQIEEVLKLKKDEEAKKNKPTVTKNGGLVRAIKSM